MTKDIKSQFFLKKSKNIFSNNKIIIFRNIFFFKFKLILKNEFTLFFVENFKRKFFLFKKLSYLLKK